jgi:methionine-rich copper-binding protein CopC/putative copper export protein
MRLLLRGLASALLVLLAVVLAAPAAQAHVDANEYSPATGEILQTTPDELTIILSGPPGNIDVQLFHRDGRPVPLTGAGAEVAGSTVTVTPPALDVGTYVLTWSSVGPDGHAAAGQTHFSVGAADGQPGTLPAAAAPGVPPAQTALNWAGYLSLALAIGLAWSALLGLTARPRRAAWAARAAAIAFLAVEAGRLLLVSASVAGPNGLLSGLSSVLGSSPIGVGWLLTAGGGGALLLRRPSVRLAAAAVAAVGVTATGHLSTAPAAVLLVPLAAVHLVAAGLWIGAPAAHLLVGYRGRAAHLQFAVRFTVWALAAALVVAVSGTLMVALRPGWESLGDFASYAYGQALLAKWALLAAVVLPLGTYHLVRTLMVRARQFEADRAPTPGASPGVTSAAPESTTPAAPSKLLTGLGALTIAVEAAALVGILLLGTVLSGLPASPPAASTTQAAASAAPAGDLLAYPQTFEECVGGSGSEQADGLLCVSRYLEGVALNQGMPAAIKEITSRWTGGDQWMQRNCHAVGHKLGRLAYRTFNDITTSFEQGSDPCDYGYLHGVIEGASADFTDDELREAMTTLCEPIGDTTTHTYRQCIHGLGHAAARRVNNDLPRAMEFCRPYLEGVPDPTDESDRRVLRMRMCVAGVSMEWNTQPIALDALTLPIGARGTLLGECVLLDAAFQPGCVEYGTSAMGGILERELAAREWCDANLADPLSCYQSIGRDVIWSPTITTEQAVDVCTGGKQGVYAEQCIIRALGSVATIELDATAIDRWCPNLPEQYRSLCPMVRDAMLVQIEQTVRGFITEPAPDQGSAPADQPAS